MTCAREMCEGRRKGCGCGDVGLVVHGVHMCKELVQSTSVSVSYLALQMLDQFVGVSIAHGLFSKLLYFLMVCNRSLNSTIHCMSDAPINKCTNHPSYTLRVRVRKDS